MFDIFVFEHIFNSMTATFFKQVVPDRGSPHCIKVSLQELLDSAFVYVLHNVPTCLESGPYCNNGPYLLLDSEFTHNFSLEFLEMKFEFLYVVHTTCSFCSFLDKYQLWCVSIDAERCTWDKQVGAVLSGAVFCKDAEGVEALVVLRQVRQRETGRSSTHRHLHQVTGLQQLICSHRDGRHSEEWPNTTNSIKS